MGCRRDTLETPLRFASVHTLTLALPLRSSVTRLRMRPSQPGTTRTSGKAVGGLSACGRADSSPMTYAPWRVGGSRLQTVRAPPLDRALSGASEGLKSAWRGLVRGRTSYAYDPREGGGYRWGAGATDLAPPAPPQASLKPNSSTSSGSCSRPLRAAQALSKRDV